MRSKPPQKLDELFSSLFDDHDLRKWVRDYMPVSELVNELPGNGAPLLVLAGVLVERLEKHGLINAALFEALLKARPLRREDILTVASRYLPWRDRMSFMWVPRRVWVRGGLTMLGVGALMMTLRLCGPNPPPPPPEPQGDLRLTLVYLDSQRAGEDRTQSWVEALTQALRHEPRAVLLYADRGANGLEVQRLEKVLRAHTSVLFLGVIPSSEGESVPGDRQPLLKACPGGAAEGCVVQNVRVPELIEPVTVANAAPPQRAVWDRVSPCIVASPTAALALALLAQSPTALTSPLEEECRIGEVVGMPKMAKNPCRGPYAWLWASELSTGPQGAPRDPKRSRGNEPCPGWEKLTDRVLVVVDPWGANSERTLQSSDGETTTVPNAEALAMAAWATLSVLEAR